MVWVLAGDYGRERAEGRRLSQRSELGLGSGGEDRGTLRGQGDLFDDRLGYFEVL